jgi:primosomal protein N' (replication factor Y)
LPSILEVAIPVPLNKTFDYVSYQEVAVGARVRVPFGRKKVIGIVLAQKDKSDFDKRW